MSFSLENTTGDVLEDKKTLSTPETQQKKIQGLTEVESRDLELLKESIALHRKLIASMKKYTIGEMSLEDTLALDELTFNLKAQERERRRLEKKQVPAKIDLIEKQMTDEWWGKDGSKIAEKYN